MRRRAKPSKRAREASGSAAIDSYLAGLDHDKQATLQRLRQIIRKIRPDAEECISYGMPAFRVKGEVVAGFAATSRGCSYYPFSGSTLKALAGDLRGYSQTRSALHFTPGKPLSAALVRKLIDARIHLQRARRRRRTRTSAT